MKKFKKILAYAAPYKGYVLLNIIFNIFAVIFELLSLLLFIPFLSLIFGTMQPVLHKPQFAFTKEYLEDLFTYYLSQQIDGSDKTGALILVCILVAALFFLKNLFRYLALYFISTLRNGVVRDIRQKVYAKILSLPLAFFSNERKGDIIASLTNDVQEIEWSILTGIEMVFREPIAIILSLSVMIMISPSLTLFAFILLPVSGFIIGKIGKSLRRTSTKGQNKMGELLSFIEETIGGLRIIKAFTAEDFIFRKFKTLNNDYKNLLLKMSRKRDLASPVSEFLGALVMVALVWYGGKLILNGQGELSGQEFIGYIIIFSRLFPPVKGITSAYSNLQRGAASADRISEILRAENTIREPAQPKTIDTFSDKIEYQNVSFAYESENVLNNINFTLNKGKTIALVGESGGGKSTIADLLPRFYDVSQGKITLDGIDIRELSIKNLRQFMGIVTQESILFNDTIFNNIAFGNEQATEEEVVRAAKIANAHEFIMQMPNGYQTNIGDRGNKLSGGQRQRISIARAILKNPPVLILDEATSALDTESEKLVQEALNKLMKNRTSLVIAHRLSTIQHADEILVLQKGKIVERGTHQELLSRQGVYKKLHDLQSFN